MSDASPNPDGLSDALYLAFRGDGAPWKSFASDVVSRKQIHDGPVQLWLEQRPQPNHTVHTHALVWPSLWTRSHLPALRRTPEKHSRCPGLRRLFRSQSLLVPDLLVHPGARSVEELAEWASVHLKPEGLLTRLWEPGEGDCEGPGESGSVMRLAAETELAIELGDPWRKIAAERVGDAIEQASAASPLKRRPSEERDLTQLLVRLSLTPETARRAFGDDKPR